MHLISLFLSLFIHTVRSQDFLSLLSPFLGSGLGGNNAGGGAAVGNAAGAFGGLLSQFAGTGNSAGPGSNMPFAELAQLGMQLFNKAPPPSLSRPAPSPSVPSTSDYDEFETAPVERAPSQQLRRAQAAAKMRALRAKQAKNRAQAARIIRARQQAAARARAQKGRAKQTPRQTVAQARALQNQQKRQRELRKQQQQSLRQHQQRLIQQQAQAAARRRLANVKSKPPPPRPPPPPPQTTRAPAPPPPPPPPPTHQMTRIDEDYEDIPIALTGVRKPNLLAPPPPPPARFNPRRNIQSPPQASPLMKPQRSLIRPSFRSFFIRPVATVPPTTTVPKFELPKLPNGGDQILSDRVKAFAQPNRVFKMLQEVSQYSDVHQQADADFGSVQKLMQSFFGAMANMNEGQAMDIHLDPVYDGTEMGANRPLTNQLFESDMVLTVEQLKGVVLGATEGSRGRRKRKVITGGVYRWPKGQRIPYKFKGGDETWKNLIRSGLAIWESETCLRFGENVQAKDHIVFFRGSGCYSSVGRTGGSQMISIGYGCEDKGIVTHEVGHSLGFWHEQSRPDRDQYIRLNKPRIIKGTEGNFVKRTVSEIDDMGLPYDLGSVMHYGSTAFTTDWDDHTIITSDKNYQRTIGQRKGPSFIDVKQVNRLYCVGNCPVDPGCQNSGYPDPNDCSKCKCPPGLGGRLCNEVAPSNRQCGGELIATGLWQELPYRGKGKCNWRIKAPNARIRYILSKVEFRCEDVCKAFVEVKANSDFQQTGFRKCCDDGEIELTSEQAEMLVMTDSTILEYETKFSLRYIMDSGAPLPKPPPPVWVPGTENRSFRGTGKVGPVEQFILNAIPKVRDVNRPLESITSILTEYTIGTLLGATKK